MDLKDRPAWRMRTVFEQKIMSPYRDTYRGELGLAQVETLEELYGVDALRQQELAERLRTSKQHASKVVNRLVELGLVELEPDPDDGRGHLVKLSEKGRSFLDAHIEEGGKKYRDLLESLTPEKQEELDRAMETVATLLEKL